jgi:hypothetical protein
MELVSCIQATLLVLTRFYGPTALPVGTGLGAHWIGGWSGSRAALNVAGNRNAVSRPVPSRYAH